MDLHTREKILSVILIIKDIGKLIFHAFCITVIICVCLENQWFILPDSSIDITNREFYGVFSCILLIIPFAVFYYACIGKYTVILEEIKIEENYGKAKLRKFRRGFRRVK